MWGGPAITRLLVVDSFTRAGVRAMACRIVDSGTVSEPKRYWGGMSKLEQLGHGSSFYVWLEDTNVRLVMSQEYVS